MKLVPAPALPLALRRFLRPRPFDEAVGALHLLLPHLPPLSGHAEVSSAAARSAIAGLNRGAVIDEIDTISLQQSPLVITLAGCDYCSLARPTSPCCHDVVVTIRGLCGGQEGPFDSEARAERTDTRVRNSSSVAGEIKRRACLCR